MIFKYDYGVFKKKAFCFKNSNAIWVTQKDRIRIRNTPFSKPYFPKKKPLQISVDTGAPLPGQIFLK